MQRKDVVEVLLAYSMEQDIIDGMLNDFDQWGAECFALTPCK